MSAESRRGRQERGVLARYLGPSHVEQMLGVSPDQLDAWAAGDARVHSADAVEDVYLCFQYAARILGFEDAHIWFTASNATLDGATPAQALADGDTTHALMAARIDSPLSDVPLVALDRYGIPRVALAGDWHGNLGHAVGSIQRLGKMGIRTLLHLGDFGLWPGPHGSKFIRRVTQECDTYDITILVTDGNHEDHARLALIEPADGVRWITDRIGYFERGHRWTWHNTKFVSLGGAPSVNRADLTEGRSWWPGEQITDADVAKAISGDMADVMLTHDSPEPATLSVKRIIRHNPQGWPKEALEYAAQGRARLSYAFELICPRLLVHGHHHVVDRATVWIPEGHSNPTEIVSLGCDGMGGNLAILDIESLEVTVI